MSEFDLPKLEGLPEGPWRVVKGPKIILRILDAKNNNVADTYDDYRIANAIAAIPDMVREIERLRTPWRVQLDSYRAENGRLRAENADLRKGIQDYLDGNYDGPPLNKVDMCPHGHFKWETCDACIDKHFIALLARTAADETEAKAEG